LPPLLLGGGGGGHHRRDPRTIAALKHIIREETVMVWEEMTGTVMGRMHSKNTRVCTDGWKLSW